MPPKLDPNFFQAGYIRFGGKWMRAYKPTFKNHGFSMAAKRTFKTATGASNYSRRMLARWLRMYDAAIKQIEIKQIESENQALLETSKQLVEDQLEQVPA